MANCEYCGKPNAKEMRFGVPYCKECFDAIRRRNRDYFDRIGAQNATDRAIADVKSSVITDEELAKRNKEYEERRGQEWRDEVERYSKLAVWCTTTDDFATADIVEYLGIAVGSTTYTIAGLVGEGLFRQGKAFNDAKQEMFHEALSLGANAVVGMKFTIESISSLFVAVVVTGTAVIIKEKQKKEG